MHAHFMHDIREGMKVFDNTNKQIGTVEWVKFGDDDPLTPEGGYRAVGSRPQAYAGAYSAGCNRTDTLLMQ